MLSQTTAVDGIQHDRDSNQRSPDHNGSNLSLVYTWCIAKVPTSACLNVHHTQAQCICQSSQLHGGTGVDIKPKLDNFEERLVAEIRSYRHLYDSYMMDHRDNQISLNSWREIAVSTGKARQFEESGLQASINMFFDAANAEPLRHHLRSTWYVCWATRSP